MKRNTTTSTRTWTWLKGAQKVEEMKRSLVSQQTMFKKVISQSEATVNCGSRDRKISPAFQWGRVCEKCMMKVCDLVCPEKKQAFSNVGLSRNTVADRTCDCWISPLAVDESSDTSDTAQLAVFIRGVDSNLCVTEEAFGIKINAWHNHGKGNLWRGF